MPGSPALVSHPLYGLDLGMIPQMGPICHEHMASLAGEIVLGFGAPHSAICCMDHKQLIRLEKSSQESERALEAKVGPSSFTLQTLVVLLWWHLLIHLQVEVSSFQAALRPHLQQQTS